MKKFVALILAVAMIASIAIIPSFAESKASITLDKTEVEINADGSYELNATITGATTYETWLAIYNKAQLEAAGGDYKACGHYGWIYAQNNGRELDKNVIVADGTTVDFGSAKLISTTHGTMLGGEYVAVMFHDDGLNEYDDAKGDDTNGPGYVPIATVDFTVKNEHVEYVNVYGTQNVPSHATSAVYWLNPDDGTIFTTEFDAALPFIGVNMVAWTSKPGFARFEFYKDGSEEPVYSTIAELAESASNVIKFTDDKGEELALEPGSYRWDITAATLDDLTEEQAAKLTADNYVVVATRNVNESVANHIYSYYNDDPDTELWLQEVTGEEEELQVIAAKFLVKSNMALMATDFFAKEGGEEEPTEAPTEAPATDAPTEAPATDAPTAAPTEAPTEAPKVDKKGCGSVIGGGVAIAAVMAAAALIMRKKED